MIKAFDSLRFFKQIVGAKAAHFKGNPKLWYSILSSDMAFWRNPYRKIRRKPFLLWIMVCWMLLIGNWKQDMFNRSIITKPLTHSFTHLVNSSPVRQEFWQSERVRLRARARVCVYIPPPHWYDQFRFKSVPTQWLPLLGRLFLRQSRSWSNINMEYVYQCFCLLQ